MGTAAPDVVDAGGLEAEADAGVGPAPILEEGVGIPEVRGRSDALEAPANAGDCVGAAGSGVAVVALGLRTFW